MCVRASVHACERACKRAGVRLEGETDEMLHAACLENEAQRG